MALCKTTVLKMYNMVIEDVISGVRDVFADEGIDEQVLLELKTLWETKLMASKAVDPNIETVDVKQGKPKAEPSSSNANFQQQIMKRPVYNQNSVDNKPNKAIYNNTTPDNNIIVPNQQNASQPQPQNHIAAAQAAAAAAAVAAAAAATEDKMIPIQITLPTQPTVDAVTRVLTIHVPSSTLNGTQLHSLLTGPVITATMGLPTPLASSLLQQHVNAALQNRQQQAQMKLALPQSDGTVDSQQCSSSTSRKQRPQKPITIEFITRKHGTDGNLDTSDDDDDATDEEPTDEEADEEKEEEDQEIDEAAPEEEPLNSEDDVTDEEPTDLFDTDNVVVCQYDKITRSRNKWKFYLKDGIMNLEGEDFVFQKANGDAEW